MWVGISGWVWCEHGGEVSVGISGCGVSMGACEGGLKCVYWCDHGRKVGMKEVDAVVRDYASVWY